MAKNWNGVEKKITSIFEIHISFTVCRQYQRFFQLKDEYLNLIERFVRSQVCDEEIPSGSDPSLFYGCHAATDFSFSDKDVQLILQIKTLITENGATEHTFTYILKYICAFILLIASPIIYDFSLINLPIPERSTVRKFLDKNKVSAVEGIFSIKIIEINW